MSPEEHAATELHAKTDAMERVNMRVRIFMLEGALRDVVETSHGAGAEHWSACERARVLLQTTK